MIGAPSLRPTEEVLLSRLQQCEHRMESLKECFRISGLINSTLDLDAVLESIMTTSRAILRADACSLLLVDEATEELVFQVAQGPVAHHLKAGLRLKKGQGIAGYVFETGEPILIEDAYQHPRFHPGFDRQTGYRTRSILCVPLRTKNRVIGVSQVINRLDGNPFDSEDMENLVLLCDHAAIAIENARMHQALMHKQQLDHDLAFATTIQLSFLPQETPQIEGFRFKAHYQAAQEVGGDFYDFIPLEGDRLGLLIGDVSGKGVSAALFMARLTSDFRLLAIRHRDPNYLVEQINRRVCRYSHRGMFVTLLYMVLDLSRKSLTYANAGHLPALLWNAREKHLEVLRRAGGPPLGILADQNYEHGCILLHSGDCLLMATDGLIEAQNPQGERMGWKHVEEAVRRGGAQAEEVYESVMEAAKAFAGNRPPVDDTTLVLMSVES